MTNQPAARRSLGKEALKLCLGTAAIFALVLSLDAQETIGSKGSKTEIKGSEKTIPNMPPVKDKDFEGKKADPNLRPVVDQLDAEQPGRAGQGNFARSRSVVRQGYTRPGNPDDGFDPRTNKVLPVAFGADTMKVLGATVYFAVYERSGLGESDTWGAGLASFDGRFVEGQNFQGGYSPRLDTKAKYLYVYQIVNDRTLEPRKNKTALAVDGGEKTPSAEDISTFYLKLLVDPRYITSWGHFRGAGFTAEVANRDQTGEIKAMADGVTTDIRLAVSSNPSILAELPNQRYMRRAPAHALQQLGNSFSLGSSTLNLAATTYQQNLAATAKANPLKLIAHENNVIKAAANANEPTFAQLMYFTGEERVVGATNLIDEDIARAIFRVDFKGAQLLKHGQHSVAFGFTTDLPPTDEPIRIATQSAAAAIGTGVRQVAFEGDGDGMGAGGVGAGVGAGIGLAVGTAPTPSPAPAAAVAVEGGSGGGSVSAGLGGMAGGTGGGVGGLGGGVGGIGAARGATMGGGGGFGGGQGDGGGQTDGKTNGKTDQNQSGTTGSTINFTATLVNQQQQKQQQQQQQKQTNTNINNGCCCTPPGGNVVPAPASLLLGLLGLPCLYFLRRQRPGKDETEPQA